MFAFPHRRTIHRTVLVTLAVWVLALMAGVANACLPQAHEPGHGAPVHAVEPMAPAHAVEPVSHEAQCHDAWDAGALTVTKQQGPDSNHLDAAAAQTMARSPHPVSVAAIDPAVDDGLHTTGPPGAIRFLRLRL
jgi:hypothetical protein